MKTTLFILASLFSLNVIADVKCDPNLSSPGECWTNCKTADGITICDILVIDVEWPESGKKINALKSNQRSIQMGQWKTKRVKGKLVKGRRVK